MYLSVYELNRDQMRELKERYLTQLADEGSFAEVMDVDYDAPSYWDIMHADDIVPDDVIYRQWDGVSFVPDDFFCTAAVC